LNYSAFSIMSIVSHVENALVIVRLSWLGLCCHQTLFPYSDSSQSVNLIPAVSEPCPTITQEGQNGVWHKSKRSERKRRKSHQRRTLTELSAARER
jgi:hypothetical protein